MTKEVAGADGFGGARPSSLYDILIDGLGFDWKDRSAFNAALLDSKDPHALARAVFEIERVINRVSGWERHEPGPGEIAARLHGILAALRDLRGGLKELDPGAVERWGRTALDSPGREAVWEAIAALTVDAGMDDGTPCPVWRSFDDLEEAEPHFAVLHEAARTAAMWKPSGDSASGRPANRPAYQVAGIVAELFRNFGRAPTYPTGTSPFKRTLRRVFAAEKITASPDGPGKWAARGQKSAK
jgi:hypothetical protein